MYPSGADSDFGAESVSVAIGKSSGCIVKYARRVDLLEELVGRVLVVGANGFGMPTSMGMDELDGIRQGVDGTDCQNSIAIFGRSVGRLHWLGIGKMGDGARIGSHFYLRIP